MVEGMSEDFIQTLAGLPVWRKIKRFPYGGNPASYFLLKTKRGGLKILSPHFGKEYRRILFSDYDVTHFVELGYAVEGKQ